jgi:hypothetical protein
MNFRKANIAIVVSLSVMLVGCWLADWDPSDDAAALIMTAVLVSGYATLMLLPPRPQRSPRR